MVLEAVGVAAAIGLLLLVVILARAGHETESGRFRSRWPRRYACRAHDLRRVIGDGEAIPDGEVEGLEERDLLELYRSMVLLRTYDERSVVFHSQGRIGTYAIFWNHEAMQAGSVYALDEDDWIFPSYRESAIGLLRGMPVSTVLSWWRGHPAGWWNPLDFNVASICVPIGTHVPHAAGLAWGKKLRGEPTRARSRTSATARPRRARSTRAPTSRR